MIVQRIERTHNPRLQDKYLAEVQDIAGLCDRKVRDPLDEIDALRVESYDGLQINEFLLYHGAKADLVDHLQHQGFDPRRAGTNMGKMFGMGTYLASNSSKSDIYTEPNSDGERCLLVVRACLGEPHKASAADPSLVKPPDRDDDHGNKGALNCVVGLTQAQGGVLQHPEYIVYTGAQTLPEYAVWYKHKDTCRCTHCKVINVTVPNLDANGLPHAGQKRWYQLTLHVTETDTAKKVLQMVRLQLKSIAENPERSAPLVQFAAFVAEKGLMLGFKPGNITLHLNSKETLCQSEVPYGATLRLIRKHELLNGKTQSEHSCGICGDSLHEMGDSEFISLGDPQSMATLLATRGDAHKVRKDFSQVLQGRCGHAHHRDCMDGVKICSHMNCDCTEFAVLCVDHYSN